MAQSGGLQPGTILNNQYRILERVGTGGMGAVYRAANIFMEEDHVAVKVIRAEQAQDDVFRQMFGKEVKAMLRLNNPRLVSYRTFAHDPELDLSFIVTEFIDGPSLKSLVGKRRFTPHELLSLTSELAIGLRAAHRAGIVHRDMAPDNILLEDGDIARPKIIDFGIVKDTTEGSTTIIGDGFAGKYNFVAPEQLGEPDYPIGPWTDIFSLGLVILGLARGAKIDMGDTPGAAIRKRRELPDLSCVPEPMRPLLSGMLAAHPDDRLRSADEVLGRIGPLFTEVDGWREPEETAPTTVVVSPAAEAEEETQFLEQGFADSEDRDQVEEDFEEPSSGGAAKWLILAVLVLAAIAIAVFGGKWFGDLIGGPTGEIEEVAPPSPTTTPEPLPRETEPAPIEPPAQLLPQLAVAVSVAPDAPRRPIEPEGWVRQENLPRQMFGEDTVRGVIAAYLEVSRDGSVTSCTIGSSSEVDPQRALQAAGTSVCRALQANARFEPLPAEPVTDLAAPLPDGEAPPTSEPESDEVFVRVAFRTMRPPPAQEASE